MKKWNQKAIRANRKKAREGQKKRKQKSGPTGGVQKPIAATKPRSTLTGNRFESCFQPHGELDHDYALLESIGRKYGVPNLATFRMSDYLATMSTREMFYRIELLFRSRLPGTREVAWWDGLYNFRDAEIIQDRRFSETLVSFRPYEFPEVHASLDEAMEVFNGIMCAKDVIWPSNPTMGDDLRLQGCWLIGCDNDSPIHTDEGSWVANEDESYETLKMQRLVFLLCQANGVLEDFA